MNAREEMISLNAGCGGDARGTIRLDIKPFPAVNILGSVEHLPFRGDSIPKVLCKSVLEHVVDPRLALSELVRAMTPRGVAEVGVPKVKYANNSVSCLMHFFLNYPVSLTPYFVKWLVRRIKRIKNRDPAIYHRHIITRKLIEEYYKIEGITEVGDMLYRFLNSGRKSKYFRNKPRIHSSYLFVCRGLR